MHEYQGTIQQTLSKQEKFQERAQIPRFQGQNKTEGGNLLMSRTPFIRHVGQGLQLSSAGAEVFLIVIQSRA